MSQVKTFVFDLSALESSKGLKKALLSISASSEKEAREKIKEDSYPGWPGVNAPCIDDGEPKHIPLCCGGSCGQEKYVSKERSWQKQNYMGVISYLRDPISRAKSYWYEGSPIYNFYMKENHVKK